MYDGTDNLIMRFDYADARMPVAMNRSGVTYYLTYDQVGSLRLITDALGNVTKKIDYDSFGSIINDTNQGFQVPYGFAGGLHDRDTGLVRFGFRDYDPDTGKWTAKDPILFAGGGVDLYGYVGNNPVNWIDPWGLQRVIGTIPGPSGQPVPIVRDTETGRNTIGFPDAYTDPFTALLEDAVSKGAMAVDKFFDNPCSNEVTKAAPMLPITDWTTFSYDAYALAQGFYKEFFQPYVRSLIKK